MALARADVKASTAAADRSPVAVVDRRDGAQAPASQRGSLAQAAADVALAVREWIGGGAPLAFLHNNHLGATEAVTDETGAALWTAEYQPFGRLASLRRQQGYVMGRRLPGQFEDEETGLYYNDHRYYDPDAGRYISPDPLGLRGRINSYVYADGNPLRFVDPSGLLLFAFDGTDNSQTPFPGDEISNVVKFHSVYLGPSYYITGIGTTDSAMSYKGDNKSGDGIDERLALAFTYLDEHIAESAETGALTIDIIGFSRGAATARAWVNQLRANDRAGLSGWGKIPLH